MLNQVILVGRLVSDPKRTKDLKVRLCLAIPRSYKNEDGEYLMDYVDVIYSGVTAENAMEYLKKSSLVGVKGRIETEKNNILIVGERITFLSSKLNGEN